MTELDGLRSDVWLAQCEKRARARRNANLKKFLLVVTWAMVMGVAVTEFMKWWATQ